MIIEFSFCSFVGELAVPLAELLPGKNSSGKYPSGKFVCISLSGLFTETLDVLLIRGSGTLDVLLIRGSGTLDVLLIRGTSTGRVERVTLGIAIGRLLQILYQC